MRIVVSGKDVVTNERILQDFSGITQVHVERNQLFLYRDAEDYAAKFGPNAWETVTISRILS